MPKRDAGQLGLFAPPSKPEPPPPPPRDPWAWEKAPIFGNRDDGYPGWTCSPAEGVVVLLEDAPDADGLEWAVVTREGVLGEGVALTKDGARDAARACLVAAQDSLAAA